jgi:hypothetical protein
MHLETAIFDENDQLIQINGYLIKGKPGIRDVYGQMETPDDEDEVEIESAFLEDKEIELTEEQTKWALQALFEEISN